MDGREGYYFAGVGDWNGWGDILMCLSMNPCEQMEFEALLVLLQPKAVAMTRRERPRRLLAGTPPEQFAVILLRAVTEENMSFSTYAIMMAVAGHAQPPSMASITIETGYSYFAVRNQVERTPWFEKTHTDLVRLSLTEGARAKLARVAKRVARYV